MQFGSRFCYDVAVARALAKFTTSKPLLPYLTSDAEIILYDAIKKNSKTLINHSFNSFINFVRVSLDLYTYDQNSEWRCWKNGFYPGIDVYVTQMRATPIFEQRSIGSSLVNFKSKLIFMSGGKI